MNKKSQASLELMTALTLVILITSFISAPMLQRHIGIMLQARALNALNNCEGFSNAVTQTLRENGLRMHFYNFFNLTIDSEYLQLISEYEDGVILCTISTKNLVNETNSNYFTLTDGEYYLFNNNGTVEVQVI